MSLVSNKKIVSLFIVFVLIVACMFTAGLSLHTNKVYAGANTFSVSDGAVNGSLMEFTVSREFSVDAATVYYRTISGTAIDGTHFTGAQGQLNFAIGESSKTVSIEILGANTQYGGSVSSAYTNIDRDFYLEIYATSEHNIADVIGTGTISASAQYNVNSNCFTSTALFSLEMLDPVQPFYPNYIVSIPSAGGYYDAVGSEYLLKASVHFVNVAQDEIFTVGFAKTQIGAEEYYGNYQLGSLIGVGLAEYAVQVYSNSAGNCLVTLPDSVLAENITVASTASRNPLIDYMIYMDNSVSGSNYLFIESLSEGTGACGGIAVEGRVIDTQAPTLLGIAGLNHPQKAGDDLYISFIFDEIISSDLSTLVDSKIISDSGDFVYQYGAGSNVLVFKGELNEGITDTINFGVFDGEIRDLSNNLTALNVPQQSVTVQDEYTVEHYLYTPSGFVVGQTQRFFYTVGATANAVAIDFSELGVDGYTLVDTDDTLDSGTVAQGGTLVLKLYYKLTDVYLSGMGIDAAVGDTPENPVLTFAEAKNRLAPDGTIHIVNTVTVTGIETWSLEGLGAAKISRYAKNYNLIEVTGELTLTNIVIDGNKTALGMGSKSMVKNNTSGTLVLQTGAILQNADSRNSERGAAVINDGYLAISNAEIKDNTAISGGAIHNLGTIELYSGKISGNIATGSGGGIYNQEGEITLFGGVLENNTAQSISGGGGAIYNYSGTLSFGSLAKLNNNTASGSDGKGGAILSTGITMNKSQVILSGAEIYNNTAKNGGGIYTDSNAIFSMESGKIYNNTATLYGGGISYASEYIDGNSFEGGEISGNSASVGGGLYLFGGEFVMIDTAIISGNTALTNGGGISIIEAAAFVMTGGSITDNTATANDSAGGGIYNVGALTITGGTMDGNTAYSNIGFNGGGIANLGGSFSLAGSATITDIIYLDYNNKITLTELPDTGAFSLFITDWTIDESVVEGATDILAGTKYQNFSIINPGMVLRSSLDTNDIVVKTALAITFDKNSAAAIGAMPKQYVLENETFSLIPNSFTRDRYFFLGWATSAGGTVQYADEAQYTMGASNVTLYAKWLKTIPSWQDGYAATAFDGGDGTVETPYLISNGAQLAYLASLVNAGNFDYTSKAYKLTDNIDLSIDNFPELSELGVQKILWIAIGNASSYFSGSFDGDGYVISGLDFDLGEDAGPYYGLFGTTYEADIKNVGISNINIVGESENATIGSFVAEAFGTKLTNVFVEGLTVDITLDLGYVGVIIGHGYDNCEILNFYVNCDSSGIVLNGTPSKGGTYGASEDSAARIGYVYMSGIEESIYLYDTQEDIDVETVFGILYDLAVAYNASVLKAGEELRLYRWIDVSGGYPTLEKIVLRSSVKINYMLAPLYEVGKETVRTFDEAILSIAKDGVIIIQHTYIINQNAYWTLPEEIFGSAYITGFPEYNYEDAFVIVPVGITLQMQNIDIINNATDDRIYMFYIDGALNIGAGTTISGQAITTSTGMYLSDNETNSISLGAIALTEDSPVILEGPLYSDLIFDEFPDLSTVVAGDGTNVTDVSGYIGNCSVTWTDSYHIQAEGNIIRGYTKKFDLYFDVTAPDGGNGDELTPVNSLEMVKALTFSTVHVMSTVEISTDTVWDLDGYNFHFTNYETFSGALFNVVGAELTLKNMSIYMTAGTTVILDAGASLVLDETMIDYYLAGELGTAIVVSPTAHVHLGTSSVFAYIQLENDGVSSGKAILSAETGIGYILYIEDITENQLPVVETDVVDLDLTDYFDRFYLDSFEDRLTLVNDEVNNTINIKIQEYSVTFYDKEGGSAYGAETPQAPQTIQIYELVTQPEDPFRLGYHFDGWYLLDGTEYVVYDFETQVTEDLQIVAFWSNYFATEDAEGTELSPFVISEYAHLENMSDLFSLESVVYDSYKDKYYTIINDITAEEDFVPISIHENNYFYGTLNGNGHVVTLNMNTTFAALIIANYGIITNVGIDGAISGMMAGGIAVINTGIISNCFNGATINASAGGAGISAFNYDAHNYPPDTNLELIDSGEIINCYNIGAIEGEDRGYFGGITTFYGSVIGCYNAAAVEGSPIAVDAEIIDCYFSRDYYEDEAGLYTLSMVGQSTDTHQNLLYNSLSINAPGVWSQPENDGNTWFYPQLKVFYDNGNYIYYETVYTVEINFQNGEPNAIEYAVMNGYAPLPVEPTKPLYLFDGWTLDGGDFDFEIDTINGDLYIVARWAIYQLIFDGTGLRIIGITIADGQQDVVVTIPDFVTHIEIYAFSGKDVITSVVFAENSSIISIWTHAFFDTSITELNIPANIITIYSNALGGMTLLESITVEDGAGNHKTQDGVLYNADMTTLLFYPLNKADTTFVVPSSVTRINDYAFYESTYQYGNPNLQEITLPDGLSSVGNVGLYGLSNLVRVITNNTTPLFTPDANVFRYFDETEWIKKINDNLVIELPSYTVYTNYMADSGWDDFDGYYSYPIVVTFNYQGATDRNTELTRTTVNGTVGGDLIYNGMAMGTMPSPLYFGKDFNEWNTSSDGTGDTLTADTLLYADTQAFAIWEDWVSIILSNGEEGAILVNGEEYPGETLDDIIAVDTVDDIYFSDFSAAEQMTIVNKSIIIWGSLSLDFPGIPIMVSGSSSVIMGFESLTAPTSIVYMLAGSDGANVTYVQSTWVHTFVQSPDIAVDIRPEGVSVPDPGDGYNILCWNAAGTVGRNQTSMSYEDLPSEHIYSPVVAPEVYITDTTVDCIYNGSEQGATYTTNQVLIDGECDITYFATPEDRLSGINAIAVPKVVGTYYYVISREGRTDFCDADEVLGSYSIDKATVTVASTGTAISKTFNGNDSYAGPFVEDTHYTVTGIVDYAHVGIISIVFNSIHVDATHATVTVTINDTANYTVNDTFDCPAIINPLATEIFWEIEDEYYYTAQSQDATVIAYYYDILDEQIFVDVLFSGEGEEFRTAGTYTVRATMDDDDYFNDLLPFELVINKAEITVTFEGICLTKEYDGSDIYNGEFTENIHYTVEGIVDDAYISIDGIVFNSANVGEANQAVITYTLSDEDNYQAIGMLEVAAEVLPLEVIAEWVLQDSYIYNGFDQIDEVSVYYIDINNSEVYMSFSFAEWEGVFKNAGTYTATAVNDDPNYELVSDECSVEMQKAEVVINSVGSITKVYDGNTAYSGSLILGTHYTVTGIVDSEEVTVVGMYFDSPDVASVTEFTAELSLNGANYTFNDKIYFAASIMPYETAVTWQALASYTYDGSNQAGDVSASFKDINEDDTPLLIAYSGESEEFITAGDYLATAYTTDSNYLLTNETLSLVIDKATATIFGSIHQVHTFDGAQKNVEAEVYNDETTLTYAPQQGYIAAGTYNITVSAIETDNYLAAELLVVLEIQKAVYADISHAQMFDVYVPELILGDIELNQDFYWLTPDMLIFAGEEQSFEAYYNADFDNYESYSLQILVTIDKADPNIITLPSAEDLIAGRELSVSALTGGVAGVPGTFAWVDGSEVISTAGINTRQAAFTPDDENYYSAAFDINVRTYFLEVNFVSFESQTVVYVTYDATLAVIDFPAPAQKTGYTVEWEVQEDIENITVDATVNAVYTLIAPEVIISGYTEVVTYGTTVTLQADPSHELGTVIFFYQWFYNDELVPELDSNFVILTQVAESGNYRVIVAGTDGEQTKYAEAEVQVVINKAQAVITADATQEHTYDGGQKDVIAELDHSETALVYSQLGYTEANEAGYVVTLSAEETANYLAVVSEVLLVINKATVDMSGVSFPDGSFVYDGESHSIALVGELPVLVGGLSVNYLYNSLDTVGEREVIAEFVYNQNNYNQIEDMLAVITITPRPINIIIHDKQSVYGQAQVELTCTVTNLVDGDDLMLTLMKAGTMNAGEYAITGSIGNMNYDPDFTNGTYSVLKATHDMSGISFNNKTVIYNAAAQSLVITGSLPTGVTASYANNTARDHGSYNAMVTFGYDTANYTAIAPMSATLTIIPRPITVTFLDYSALYYDGSVKTVGARLNNVPQAETDEIEAIIAYDKEVIEADYYTATVTITNTNYTLTGETQLDFIVYLSKLEHMKEQETDVVASLIPGFLPGTTIVVTNISQRVVIASGEYEGKESKQHFEISILGNQLSAGQKITMRLLISGEYRFLENLKVGKLEEDGSLSEIDSVREGDYLVFEVSDTQAKYVIIGDGKNSVLWVYGAIGGGLTLIALATALVAEAIKRRNILKRKVLGL